MKLLLKKTLDLKRADVIVLPVFQDRSAQPIEREFAEARALRAWLSLRPAPASKRQDILFYSVAHGKPVLLAPAPDWTDAAEARKLACRIMEKLRPLRCRSIALAFLQGGAPPEEYLRNFVDYLLLNSYRFDRYQCAPPLEAPSLERVTLCFPTAGPSPVSPVWSRERLAVHESVCFCRDLVNETPSLVTPDYLLATARELAREKRLHLEALRSAELRRRGCNGLLAVGGSSPYEPALIKLTYTPPAFRRTLALVGKGITFDSGGLNIKTGSGMEEMKADMAGAAVVLGCLRAVADLRLPLRLIGVAAVAENMPGRSAYKPGDIIRYANGKNVEVVNTDAEGRLALADALIMAAADKPDAVIEISTLTHSIVKALGEAIAGLMGSDRRLNKALVEAGQRCGELLWELPLFSEYREAISSKVAHLKNAGYADASAIKAGLFLNEFCAGVPFVHIDIAGTAFLSKPTFCLASTGATGFGVRLLLEALPAILASDFLAEIDK